MWRKTVYGKTSSFHLHYALYVITSPLLRWINPLLAIFFLTSCSSFVYLKQTPGCNWRVYFWDFLVFSLRIFFYFLAPYVITRLLLRMFLLSPASTPLYPTCQTLSRMPGSLPETRRRGVQIIFYLMLHFLLTFSQPYSYNSSTLLNGGEWFCICCSPFLSVQINMQDRSKRSNLAMLPPPIPDYPLKILYTFRFNR